MDEWDKKLFFDIKDINMLILNWDSSKLKYFLTSTLKHLSDSLRTHDGDTLKSTHSTLKSWLFK